MAEQNSEKYDLIVIGAGPGGYVCAIRAAQLGMKVACVEKRKTLGGTCLNIGCIPSKALLQDSEKFEAARDHFADLGIKTGQVELDLKKMMSHKDDVVKSNTDGIDYLFKKNKIEHIEGEGKIIETGVVEVSGKKYEADNIVIATGSEVATLPNIEIDEDRIVSSTGALEFDEVPKKLAVIGGGYIGLELGTVWRRLGAEVTVIEFLDQIIPAMDKDLSKEMHKILKGEGINFKLGTKVTEARVNKKSVTLKMEPANGEGDSENLNVDAVLVAIGRKPNTQGLGLEEAGIETDDKGRIKTDEFFETSLEGVYAIGDVIAGPMLAHKAEEEGVVLAEMLDGQSGHIDYNLIPGVIYTWPEVASVGKTEQQLQDDGVDYKSGTFPFMANGRARAMNMTKGFVKILADSKTDEILGAHIIGPEAGTLIAEVTAVMEFGGTSEDIARTCHAHPTLEEAVKEAALAVHGRALHI